MRSYMIPILLFLALAGVFMWRLASPPPAMVSPMIGQAMPEFSLSPLQEGAAFSSQAFSGKMVLVNVFASWCASCLIEHPLLMDKKNSLPIYGIAWRDVPKNTAAWLAKHGNPYDAIGLDSDSTVITRLGVSGAPETFAVDQQGIIRAHIRGPLSEEIWQSQIQPLLEKAHE